MNNNVIVLIGTKRGLFIARSNRDRKDWKMTGPYCNVPIRDAKYDPLSKAIYAAGVREYGPDDWRHGVWKSTDLGESWTHSAVGFTFGEGGPKLERVWHVMPGNGAMYAGTEPAALFRSDDAGETWQHVEGLRQHPTTPDWGGGAGGLALHSIVPHPTDANRIWVGLSAVGVFYTEDGGKTWEIRNGGMTKDYNPGETYYGFCCHKFARAAGEEDILYMQDHGGVYRSRDGAQNWEDIRAGLSSDFGFGCAAHPRDPKTAYLAPIQDNGRFMPGAAAAIWRTRDGGDTWERLSDGLPQEHAYFQVLREGLCTDGLDPAGVYFGTNNGFVFGSADEGETWSTVASHLPYVWSVSAAVVED